MTARSGPKAYDDAFFDLCNQATKQGKGKNHVIFLDKNHPSNGLKRVIDNIRKGLPGDNVNVKKLYLIPEVPEGSWSRFTQLPFPENFLC